MVGRPARRPDRTTAVNSGRRRRRACAGSTSGGELVATLATTVAEDGATGAGPHPQPEAVGLGPATVVRLERALAHERLPPLARPVRRGPGRAAPARETSRSSARDPGLPTGTRSRGWSAVRGTRPAPEGGGHGGRAQSPHTLAGSG